MLFWFLPDSNKKKIFVPRKKNIFSSENLFFDSGAIRQLDTPKKQKPPSTKLRAGDKNTLP